MQTRILIILIVLILPSQAISQNPKLKQADSLFRAKQYTQSLSIYQNLLSQNTYSSAMLLKMAYIQEGLNHPGLCLYYLNLYQRASDDHQAIAKMEELAQKYRLEGYQQSDISSIYRFFEKNELLINRSLTALIVLSFTLMIYLKRKNKSISAPLLLVVLFSVGLFTVNNLINAPSLVIVSTNNTYLMNGPSAGASVVAIIEEGHRLPISGKKDVWLKVKWREKEVFIKESNVMPVHL